MGTLGTDKAPAQLLRRPYHSTPTDDEREYLLYLPAGYDPAGDRLWPVILFLHGGGERGDGREELNFVMWHGPLREAWIQRRDLPFILIGPQLPVFGQHDQVRLRAGRPLPERLPSGPPSRRPEERPERPMARAHDLTPSDFNVTEQWGIDGPPGGWQLCEEDLLGMVDRTLSECRGDPERVYLTGLSYGGYGTWHMATAHPDRWAAIAPMCGGADPALAPRLAERQMPTWIVQGGRDYRVKPRWAYTMANALEQAGHRSVRLTVHEDLGHDCWTRAYAGEDLYLWFLAYKRQAMEAEHGRM
jgi:predicted peptidase